MKRLSSDDFRDQLDAFDAAVRVTPDIDHFCSSSPWALSAFDALTFDHELWALAAEQADGYVALSYGDHERIGRYLQPLEASWGLCAPIVGEDVAQIVREFSEYARSVTESWDLLFLSGLVEGSPQFVELIRAFQQDHFVGLGPSMGRMSASLEGGVDGFLERRTSKFRSNIRRARRRAAEAGVEFDYFDHPDSSDEALALFDRIIAIEKTSWKGKQSAGISSGRMNDFYRKMVPRLTEREMLRVVFATVDDTDIAYCFGGVMMDTYRGLQMSYHDDFKDLSPGNIVQMEMIEALCEEGVAFYDMGQAMDYKSSWTDEELETVALIVRS
ncbi:MAG: GNAT family N-acetyltransferase [Myxococcota bacterium]